MVKFSKYVDMLNYAPIVNSFPLKLFILSNEILILYTIYISI